MRVLEQHKIAYKPHEYPHGKDAVDGVSVAELLGQNPDQVFKLSLIHIYAYQAAKIDRDAQKESTTASFRKLYTDLQEDVYKRQT